MPAIPRWRPSSRSRSPGPGSTRSSPDVSGSCSAPSTIACYPARGRHRHVAGIVVPPPLPRRPGRTGGGRHRPAPAARSVAALHAATADRSRGRVPGGVVRPPAHRCLSGVQRRDGRPWPTVGCMADVRGPDRPRPGERGVRPRPRDDRTVRRRQRCPADPGADRAPSPRGPPGPRPRAGRVPARAPDARARGDRTSRRSGSRRVSTPVPRPPPPEHRFGAGPGGPTEPVTPRRETSVRGSLSPQARRWSGRPVRPTLHVCEAPMPSPTRSRCAAGASVHQLLDVVAPALFAHDRDTLVHVVRHRRTFDLGLLPLEPGEAAIDRLVGATAPHEWHALGFVTDGTAWARAADGEPIAGEERRVRLAVLADRSGAVASSVRAVDDRGRSAPHRGRRRRAAHRLGRRRLPAGARHPHRPGGAGRRRMARRRVARCAPRGGVRHAVAPVVLGRPGRTPSPAAERAGAESARARRRRPVCRGRHVVVAARARWWPRATTPRR